MSIYEQIWKCIQQYTIKNHGNKPKYIMIHPKLFTQLVQECIDDDTFDSMVRYYSPKMKDMLFGIVLVNIDTRIDEKGFVLSTTDLSDIEYIIRTCGDAIKGEVKIDE